MELLIRFINEYGTMILYAVLVAIAGFLGTQVKQLYAKYCNNKQKKEIVETCVKAAEQIYRDLHGEEKFNAMCADVAEMAAARGINITGIEIKMLAEAAICEFNRTFEKDNTEATLGEITEPEVPTKTASK